MAGEHPATQRNFDGPLEAIFSDFSGGLDAVSKKNSIPPNAAWFTENCWSRGTIAETNLYGSLRTRPGYGTLLDPPAGVPGSLTNLRQVFTTVGVVGQWLFALYPSTGGIYYTPWPGPLAWVLATTIAGATEMRAISMNGYAIFCVYGTGVGGMFSFTGAVGSWAAIAGTPVARYIELHKGRVFVAAPDAAPFMVYYSDLFNPLVWPVTNIIPNAADANPNWQITGLKEYRDRLYVATGLAFYALAGSGPPDYVFYKSLSSHGCSAPESLESDGAWLYFLSNKGFFRWDGSSDPDNIGVPIWNYYRADFDASLASTTRCVYHDQGLYYIYRTATGTNKYRGLLHDLWGSQSRGWYPTRKDVWNFACLVTVENGLYILAGDALNGKLCRLDYLQTDGPNGIDTEWRHGHTDFSHINPAYATIPKRMSTNNAVEVLAEVDSAGSEKVEISLWPDIAASPTVLTLSSTDMDLRTGTAVAGSHISERRKPYARTIVMFVASAPQNFPHFNMVSWAVKRTGAKTAMTILSVKLNAHLAASQQ